MTSTEQNNAMKDNYMIVEIQKDVNTILPKTLDEYKRMRESSIYTISQFKNETIANIQNRIENEDSNDREPIQEKIHKVLTMTITI